jgi:hypothetical protein
MDHEKIKLDKKNKTNILKNNNLAILQTVYFALY